MLACNACWCDLDSGSAYIAACDHVFCEKDVHLGLEQRQCAVCATKMEERTIRVSEVQPDLGELQRKLTGLNPNDMLTAVAYGLKFWDDQLELRYRTELEKSFTSAQRSAEMYKRKLQDVHNAYKKAKTKQDELAAQLKERENDIEELQHRYEEKSREKRRLEDSAGRGRPSLGPQFQARTAPMMPETAGRIDTRGRTEPDGWLQQQRVSSSELRSHRSSEQLHRNLPQRRTSLTRSFDSGLTPPSNLRDSHERTFRALSPYTRQAVEPPSRPGRDSVGLFSKRRIF